MTSLTGLQVKIESTALRPCCPRCRIAIITASGSLTCDRCGTKRGSLSESTAKTIEAIIEKFGKPENPIVLRR
jgi:hypothetical protein